MPLQLSSCGPSNTISCTVLSPLGVKLELFGGDHPSPLTIIHIKLSLWKIRFAVNYFCWAITNF